MHFVRYNWWKHALSLQSNAVQSVQYMRGICRLVMRRPRYKNTTSDKLKITNMELYKQAALHTFSLQRRKSIMQQLPFKRHWCGNSIPSTSKDQRAGFSEHGQGELESSKVMMACLHSSKLHRTPHFFTAKTEVYHAAVAIQKAPVWKFNPSPPNITQAPLELVLETIVAKRWEECHKTKRKGPVTALKEKLQQGPKSLTWQSEIASVYMWSPSLPGGRFPWPWTTTIVHVSGASWQLTSGCAAATALIVSEKDP